jgi:peptide-methionine (S)-S-oxide reductase
MPQIEKLAFGGGCHWCTEAVFEQLRGVEAVEQGWVSSTVPNDDFSEAVIVHFNPDQIAVSSLIGVHLNTHAATAEHQLRGRYRSAIYYLSPDQVSDCQRALDLWQLDFSAPLLTRVLPFVSFRASLPEHLNYYASDPERPFCQRYIRPKLDLLEERFATLLSDESLGK